MLVTYLGSLTHTPRPPFVPTKTTTANCVTDHAGGGRVSHFFILISYSMTWIVVAAEKVPRVPGFATKLLNDIDGYGCREDPSRPWFCS
jgi:hypothetical protein